MIGHPATDLDMAPAMRLGRHLLLTTTPMHMGIHIRTPTTTRIGGHRLPFTTARDIGGAVVVITGVITGHIAGTADGTFTATWADVRSRVTALMAVDMSAAVPQRTARVAVDTDKV